MNEILYNYNLNIKYSDYKIIIADTDLNTFNEIAKIKEDFSFINLSSDFAVNFVMEYEKIDYILISKKINNLDKIIDKAEKRKIKVFILGKDVDTPIDFEKVRNLLLSDIKNNINTNNKKENLAKLFKNFFKFKINHQEQNKNVIFKDKENKNFIKSEASNNDNNNSNIILNENKNIIKAENKNLIIKSTNINKTQVSPELDFKNSISKKNKKEKNSFAEIISQNNLSNNVAIKEDNQNKNDCLIDSCQKLNNEDKSENENKPEKLNYQLKAFKQKIVAVTKAKGGVGSTVISIFLGSLFKNLRTLIVDLNFSEGGSDIAYYLDIPKIPNIMVFTEGFDKNSFNNSVQNVLQGLDIIQSPLTYLQSKEIDLKDIYCLTDIARKKYDLIIFDLPNNINEFYLGVIDLADLLIMVSDCTNGSIGRLLSINSKYIYEELEKILIINKFNKNNPLKVSPDNLKDYFNIKTIATLNEIDSLSSKSDFKLFNFNQFDDFKDLSNIAIEILTK